MRYKTITTPLTQEQYDLIYRAAQEAGMPKASFVRYHILKLIKTQEAAQ